MAFILLGAFELFELAVTAVEAAEAVGAAAEAVGAAAEAVGLIGESAAVATETAAAAGEVAVSATETGAVLIPTETAGLVDVGGTLITEEVGTEGALTVTEQVAQQQALAEAEAGITVAGISESMGAEATANIELAAEAEYQAILDSLGETLPEDIVGGEPTGVTPEFYAQYGDIITDEPLYKTADEGFFDIGHVPESEIFDESGITFLNDDAIQFNLDLAPTTVSEGTGFTAEKVFKALNDAAQIANAITVTGTTINNIIEVYKKYNPDPPKTTEVIHRDGDIIDPFKLGYDLGLFMSLTEKYMYRDKLGDLDAMVAAVKEDPDLIYLLKPVYDFEHNETQQNIQQFLAEVDNYDGKSIDPSGVYERDGVFCMIDEDGIEQCYTGTRGDITPVWGTYCGPFSPNDTKPMDLLDTFCFLHDIAYDKHGFFNEYADKQLMNRIKNNLDRMDFKQKTAAQAVFFYFSTIGYSLAILKTKLLPNDIDEKVVTIRTNDIFFQLSGTQSGEARTRFYQGLRVGLTKNFSIMKRETSIERVEQVRECLADLQIVWIR